MTEAPSIQWFPGHMAKTRRLMRESLRLVNVVVEVIDARIPISSRNPELPGLVGQKPRIVLLNKCDAADEMITRDWCNYYKEQGKPFIFRCTNRLDRDTSGLTVIAKHLVSSSILSFMAVRHEIHREYLAIVRGTVSPASGTINAPLARTGSSIIERKVDFEHGEHAVTHYKVLKEQNQHSLVSLILETGRTHQIRVHLQYLGHPLVGDYLYNPDMEYINRQALHSWKLSFIHPITGEAMHFEAPLPEDMRKVLG